MEAIQQAQRNLHRQERRDLRDRFRIDGQGWIWSQPGLEKGHPSREREGRHSEGLHSRSFTGNSRDERGGRRGRGLEGGYLRGGGGVVGREEVRQEVKRLTQASMITAVMFPGQDSVSPRHQGI